MLNTNPQERATLHEIMNHPWITKGFNGPPDNYLPLRKPLQLPLDPAVVKKMEGFDFGDEELITSQLTKVIESEDYQRAVRASERRSAQQAPEMERRRGVFDFYKRRNSTTSRDTLNTPSSEAVQLGNDPLNAFHPLISIYYLAHEKQEREARERNPGALAIPATPGEPPLTVPDLPAPAAAYTNSQAYEMPGEKPTGGRTRARARTHGEDEVRDGMQNLNINTAPSPTNPTIVEPGFENQQQQQQAPAPARKESAAAGLLRRLSTRRSKEPPERLARGERPSHPPPSLAVFAPADTPRKSFSVRRTRDRDPTPTGLRTDAAPPQQAGEQGALLTPPVTGDASSDKQRKHGLGRSVSVNSSDIRRRLTRRGVSEGSSMRPPMTSASSHDARKPSMDQSGASRDAASDVEGTSSRPQPAAGNVASRTKSLGHARRESVQNRRLRRGETGRTSNVPEETDQEVQDDLVDGPAEGGGGGGSGSPNSNPDPADFKPVYLKGVFSVSTTSSKPLQFIRQDIIRVLRLLSVEFTEIKGGFRCRHAPSVKAGGEEGSGQGVLSPPPQQADNGGGGHRRKISFSGFRGGGGNADRDAFRAAAQQQQQAQQQPQPTPPTPRSKLARDQSYDNTEDESDEDPPPSTSQQPNASRTAGETSTHVQTDLGENLALKFEIFVVKVPLIGLHGIQFKKIEGGTWGYKGLAQRILDGLRL